MSRWALTEEFLQEFAERRGLTIRFHGAMPEIATLGYILLGVGAIPTGLIADRWSPKKMLVVYFVWIAAACGLLVVAQSTTSLVVGLTLIGAGASIYHPVGLTMISHGPCPAAFRRLASQPSVWARRTMAVASGSMPRSLGDGG